jgi:S-ribosylhomocysteine lyase
VSREDPDFTTFDLRITEPNKEPALSPSTMHSLEHLMATWFRNSRVKSDVVYVGPMGCLTGMYVIMRPGYSVDDMRNLTIECLLCILQQTEIPGTTPATCGNYRLHSLVGAKRSAKKYLGRLQDDFHSEYSKLQVISDDGLQFADA